jgi:hypothetical protein
MEVAWTKGDSQKILQSCLTTSQIWLINGVHACQSTYLTKLEKKKNPWHLTFGQFLCPIHALFYRRFPKWVRQPSHLSWLQFFVRKSQYVTMQTCFSHPSFIILLFFNPIDKTETVGQQIRGGTTNRKPSAPIITMGQSEIGSSSQIIFITLFSPGAQCCCTLYQPPQTVQLCWAKTTIFQHVFTFLHPILLVQGHVLSTAGDCS